MAAFKQLVYIPTIKKSTWLLMTKVEEGTCLRDYSVSPPNENRTFSLDELNDLIADENSYFERLPAFSKIPFKDIEFWREQISFRNIESGLVSAIDERRLQDLFKTECKQAYSLDNPSALRATFERWVKRFECVKEKSQFNHWDNDSAMQKISATTGIGWTSQLLEASRQDGNVQFIPTGCEMTSFSLVAMELGFGISSKNNLFRSGQRDFIKPDGLGLRKNGYFTIIEVKGPQDERGLVGPLLQATCAALAVVAKKNMLRKIARTKGDCRPAFSRAEIPVQSRSLGIHVLSQASKDGGPREPWTDEVVNWCSSVLKAFSQLEYIAYSFVSATEATNLHTIHTDYLITKDGLRRITND